MRIVSRHAGHPVTEQGLTKLIIDTQPLHASAEGVSEIVKPEILEPNPSHCFLPISFERTGVGPMPKDPAIRHRGYILRQRAQRDAIQGDLFRVPFDPTGGRGQTEPIAVLALLDP